MTNKKHTEASENNAAKRTEIQMRHKQDLKLFEGELKEKDAEIREKDDNRKAKRDEEKQRKERARFVADLEHY